ncbi:MAG: hypothetical protein R2864_00245 [Syntrophotaleaceae bacterium]
MVGGFNHNFRYKGELYHVQTEDGGRKNPRIVTQLFQGGTVLGSQKQSYEQILECDDLKRQVETRMQEQHKEMLRRLRSGEFDETIAALAATAAKQAPAAEEPALAEAPPTSAVEEPEVDVDELVFAYLAGNDNHLGSLKGA